MNRNLALTIVGAIAAVSLTACSTGSYSTQPDQAGVHQNGYILINSDRTVEDCKAPSTSSMWTGLGDDVFIYPAGQRTYTFAGETEDDAKKLKADAPAIKVVKDNIQLTLVGTVSFYLETGDCEKLKKFHSNIGIKDWGGHAAWISKNEDDADYSGWESMLRTYIGQPLQRAATDAVQDNTVVQSGTKSADPTKDPAKEDAGYLSIYNGSGRAKVEKDIQQKLPEAVKNLAGDEYFKGFNIQLQKPDIPSSLKDTLTLKENAVNQNAAQVLQNQTVVTELDSIKQIVAVLGPEGYVQYQQNKLTAQQIDLLKAAIDKGQITILPVPTGTGVSLPLPAGK